MSPCRKPSHPLSPQSTGWGRILSVAHEVRKAWPLSAAHRFPWIRPSSCCVLSLMGTVGQCACSTLSPTPLPTPERLLFLIHQCYFLQRSFLDHLVQVRRLSKAPHRIALSLSSPSECDHISVSESLWCLPSPLSWSSGSGDCICFTHISVLGATKRLSGTG